MILLLIFFNFIINEESQNLVINSCGSTEIMNTYNSPKNASQCKDDKEDNCKWVRIVKDGNNKTFCAVIHGKPDNGIIEDLKTLINVDSILIESSEFYSNKFSKMIFIFFYILILLF